MSFKELLERYQKGEATPEEAHKVEEELEKFSAINDYAYQQLEDFIGESEETAEGVSEKSVKAEKEPDELFVKKIKKEIKRYFLKVGITAGCIALVVSLFTMLAMPRIVSAFYYDPGKSVKADSKESQRETNQMSLDMAVYSELYMPQTPRNCVTSQQEGYGKYQIKITSDVWYGDDEPQVTGGRIVRGKLTLYDNNALKPLSGVNFFGWYQRESAEIPLTQQDRSEQKQWKKENPGEEGNLVHGRIEREYNEDHLKQLDDRKYYCAYVTLNEMMSYEDFCKFYEKQELLGGWCAVKNMESGDDGTYFEPANLGFSLDPSSNSLLNWDQEAYPNLFSSTRDTKGVYSEEAAKAHFLDLLSYMRQQEDFLDLMDEDAAENGLRNRLEQTESYVKEHGITVYGFVARMTKAQAQKLLEQEEVYTVDVGN